MQKQNDRIYQLEARIYELEEIVKDENIEYAFKGKLSPIKQQHSYFPCLELIVIEQ